MAELAFLCFVNGCFTRYRAFTDLCKARGDPRET
jgi:hypothetical protein